MILALSSSSKKSNSLILFLTQALNYLVVSPRTQETSQVRQTLSLTTLGAYS